MGLGDSAYRNYTDQEEKRSSCDSTMNICWAETGKTYKDEQ